MSLFRSVEFELSSGIRSDFKFDCDFLVEEDWLTLGRIAARIIGPYGSVAGIPRGGLRLAAEMCKYVHPGSSCHLICDDVCTSGGSLLTAQSDYLSKYPGEIVFVQGLVVFNRGNLPSWCTALLDLDRRLRYHPYLPVGG